MDDVVNRYVSGKRALDYVTSISQFHRIQASPGIADAIEFVRRELDRLGGLRVEIFEFKTRGEGEIGTWKSLYGWTPKSATLHLVEPEKGVLADFETEPISLAAHSVSADIEAEVVYVGKGVREKDYEGKDVRGKIVLAEDRASRVHRVACGKFGAAGILTFIPPSGEDPPNFRRYEGLWPRPGEAENVRFGFSLTQSDGLKIKKWLEEGKTVRVHAQVDAELGEGTVQVLSALIEGKNKEREFWLMGHICHPHPGANDNASGSGALLEAARVLRRMMKEGVIEQPEYSIRFLWVPEWFGTILLIDSHPDVIKRCVGVINADMVGADPSRSGSIFSVYRTPYSLPTTLNNVVRYWLEHEATRKRDRAVGGCVCPLPHKYRVYSGGSDHFMFTDATLKIPAVMLNQFPDKFYHTSADTPDKIDPRQMAYAARVLVLSAITIAHRKYTIEETLLTLCRDEAVEVMRRVTHRGVRELSCCVDDPEKIYPRYMRWLDYAKELGRATLDRAEDEWDLIHVQEALLQSLRTSVDMSYMSEMMVLRKAYEGACAEIGLEAKEEELLRVDPSQFNLEIRRTLKYAMYPGTISDRRPDLLEKYLGLYERDKEMMAKVDEMLNLAEDWTSLSEIYDRVCFQFGDTDPKDFAMVVDDLAELGIIEKREIE